MGCGKQASVVYLIDFGLSKEFRDPNTHQHIPYSDSLGFAGTSIFASIHNHRGWELGRRDDLESLAYILIYFLCGSLPWQGLSHLDGGHDIVANNKEEIGSPTLCRGLPVEFASLLDYSRSLSFDAKPNYQYLFNLFDNLLLQQSLDGSHPDLTFDWDVIGGGLYLPSRRSPFKRRVGYVLILVGFFLDTNGCLQIAISEVKLPHHSTRQCCNVIPFFYFVLFCFHFLAIHYGYSSVIPHLIFYSLLSQLAILLLF